MMKIKNRHLLLALIIILLLPLLALPAFPVYAAGSYNPDWSTRVPITITNYSSSTSLYDYQLDMYVMYAPDMQTNFNDLRFTDSDGTTELNYWVMEKEDGVVALVWVKIPALPADEETVIYMYYGNPAAASASNGEATFIFFDDFGDDNALDTGKWTVMEKNTGVTLNWDSTEYVQISGASTSETGGSYDIRALEGFTPCFVADFKVEIVSFSNDAIVKVNYRKEDLLSVCADSINGGTQEGATTDGPLETGTKWFRMFLHESSDVVYETLYKDSPIYGSWLVWKSSVSYANRPFTTLQPRLRHGVPPQESGGELTERWYYYFVHECHPAMVNYEFGNEEYPSDGDPIPVAENDCGTDSATVGIDVYTVSKAGLLLPWTGLLFLMMGIIIITVRKWNRR